MPTPFKEALESGKFVVTSEVAPPKGTNLEKFKHHIDLLKDKVDAMNVTDHQRSVMRFPSLAGIILLTSAPMARFMNKNIAGVSVPQDLIDEMASAPKGQALNKGIEIAGRMIKRIHDEKMCDGVHIMAIGKEEKVPDIMAAAGLI